MVMTLCQDRRTRRGRKISRNPQSRTFERSGWRRIFRIPV